MELHEQPSGPVHFLHVGKTGGTALKHALAQKGASWVALHDHATTLAAIPPGEPVFFFLRDPLSRFVSGFFSRQRQGRPRYFSPWSKDEAKAFGQFGTPDDLATALSAASGAEQAAAAAAMRSIQHVKDSLWRWLGSPEYLLSRGADILFIGQQEHLASDAVVLAGHLGVSSLSLPDDDIAAHRNPAHLDKSLSPEAETNLRCWYRQEFVAMEVCARVARQQGFGGSLTAAGLAINAG
jgi:hypothetical protein